MAVKLQRPILIGGIGLSASLWLLNSLQEHAAEFGELALLGTLAASAGVWWFQRQVPAVAETETPLKPMTRETVAAAITQTEMMINQLETEINDNPNQLNLNDNLARLKTQLAELTPQLDRQTLKIAITGGKGVGKTTLLQVIESSWLTSQENSIEIAEYSLENTEEINQADFVIFVISGDLTEPEYQQFSQLISNYHRGILVWNKEDQCAISEQPVILQSLRETVEKFLSSDDIVTTSAAPQPVKVRQYQEDGTTQEWMEEQPPDVLSLTQRLTEIVQQDQQVLVFGTTYRRAILLQNAVKESLNLVRRNQATPIIEQYQWIAAASAFANPVPALDVLATTAISTQLIVDLGGIYQQQFSLKHAQEIAKILGTQMFKLGMVELTTQTITGLLKSSTVTYVAGGLVQGASAAYLTRIAGLSLIEYFQIQPIDFTQTENSGLNLNVLSQTIKAVFERNQASNILPAIAGQAIQKLNPKLQQQSETVPEHSA
ncbi:MAG: DUF697 domain-containing protein [Microcoleaceae cyanobacterium]